MLFKPGPARLRYLGDAIEIEQRREHTTVDYLIRHRNGHRTWANANEIVDGVEDPGLPSFIILEPGVEFERTSDGFVHIRSARRGWWRRRMDFLRAYRAAGSLSPIRAVVQANGMLKRS